MTTITSAPVLQKSSAPVLRPRRSSVGLPWTVVTAAAAVVVLRLPFISAPLGLDEAGYLAVAQQWHAGGSSLYGDYWVDRPPMLITIFRAATLLGGTVPLRLIGILAAFVAVLAVGRAAGLLAGRTSATWAAVVAAAFLVSPLAGASEVNGELLAAPFVAVGIAGLVEALASTSARRTVIASGLAGACGLSAVLVKQNMLDVFVFGVLLVIVNAKTLGGACLKRIVAGFAAGGGVAAALMALWTLAHGTSLAGVWFAMYQFRVEADRVMAAYPSAVTAPRAYHLVRAALESGMLLEAGLLTLAVVWVRQNHAAEDRVSRVVRTVPPVLLATVAFDVLSIHLGGNYWGHYLVQPAVPLAIAAGIAVASRHLTGRLVALVAVVSAAGALVVAALQPPSAGGNHVGEAIAAVSRPSDTIITVWGHADVTRSSGLTSPYPYLWSLLERTLDPHLSLLDGTLQSAEAPTWFVAWSRTGPHGVDTSKLESTLARDYHLVGDVDGAAVYLHNGVQRPSPVLGHSAP
jgi:hypothetical protein